MLVPKSNQLARFEVPLDLLAKALCLPETASICHILMVSQRRSVELTVHDDQLPPVAEGAVIPIKQPVVGVTILECGCKKQASSWDRNER